MVPTLSVSSYMCLGYAQADAHPSTHWLGRRPPLSGVRLAVVAAVCEMRLAVERLLRRWRLPR